MANPTQREKSPERGTVTVVLTKEIPVNANIKTVVVPQIRPSYLQVLVPEDATQIMFLTPHGKVTSLQRKVTQAFPETYMPIINKMINHANDGEIWTDDSRFYVFQSKPDRKKLKENVEQIITFLSVSNKMCMSKHLYYLSNGDPSWDPASLIGAVKDDWRITQFICATKKFLPVPEDPSKETESGGAPRDVKAQSRGERSIQKRYDLKKSFFKLDTHLITLELEAERIKQEYLAEKLKTRRHYHTKKGTSQDPKAIEVPTDIPPKTRGRSRRPTPRLSIHELCENPVAGSSTTDVSVPASKPKKKPAATKSKSQSVTCRINRKRAVSPSPSPAPHAEKYPPSPPKTEETAHPSSHPKSPPPTQQKAPSPRPHHISTLDGNTDETACPIMHGPVLESMPPQQSPPPQNATEDIDLSALNLAVGHCEEKLANIELSYQRSPNRSALGNYKQKKPHFQQEQLRLLKPEVTAARSGRDVSGTDSGAPPGVTSDPDVKHPGRHDVTIKIEPDDQLDIEHNLSTEDVEDPPKPSIFVTPLNYTLAVEEVTESVGKRHATEELCELQTKLQCLEASMEALKKTPTATLTPTTTQAPSRDSLGEQNGMRYFLLSLLPELETMPEEQIRAFKIKVMMLVDEIKSQTKR